MVTLRDALDAIYHADERVTELSALRNERDTIRAENATLRGELAVAVDKAQLYQGLYCDEMKRQAREIRKALTDEQLAKRAAYDEWHTRAQALDTAAYQAQRKQQEATK